MKNKKFKHKEFLRVNKIPVSSLPDMLQKRIAGFDELIEDFDHATEEDKPEMKAKINRLDLELEEDLYETYEEILENNETEPEDEEGVQVILPPKPKAPSNSQPENPDSKILENLLRKGTVSIGRSQLRKMGYKGELNGKTHRTGAYLLKKALFSYTYFIQKQS